MIVNDLVDESVVFCHWLVYYGKTFRLTLKPSSVEKNAWCYARFKNFKMKRCTCCMRVTRENLSACKAFVDFWDDHVIIPSVRVFYRHPSLQKKPLMVTCLMSDDFIVFKIHMMMMLMNMARKFGVMVEHQNSLFVLRNPRLQRSFGLAVVYKITLTAIDSVHYSRWRMVCFILLLGSGKKTVDVRHFDLFDCVFIGLAT